MRWKSVGLLVGLLGLGGGDLIGSQAAVAAPTADAAAGSSMASVSQPVGFLDADGDGLNDSFRDADGDGVCDVTGQAYPRRFAVVDANGDGVNDLFVDGDGDGVNDLDSSWADADGDGVCDNVLDADGDGRNDITGQAYGQDARSWAQGLSRKGGAAGVAGSRGRGNARGAAVEQAEAEPDAEAGMDLFIDEDGDGIADGRTVRGRQGSTWQDSRARGSQGGGKPVWAGSGGQGHSPDQGSQGRGRGRGRTDKGKKD